MNKWQDFTYNAENESRYVLSGRWNQEIQALTWISAPDLPSNHGSWFLSTATSLQPWCCLVHTQVLPAKLWQHQHTKSSIKSEENCHLSAEFTLGLSDRKEFSTKTVPWSLTQEKAQEIKWERQCRAAVLSRLPPHWATPGSPQHPGPNPAIHRSIPRNSKHTLSPLECSFPFCCNRLTWNRDFELNPTSFVPPGWCLLGLAAF